MAELVEKRGCSAALNELTDNTDKGCDGALFAGLPRPGHLWQAVASAADGAAAFTQHTHEACAANDK